MVRSMLRCLLCFSLLVGGHAGAQSAPIFSNVGQCVILPTAHFVVQEQLLEGQLSWGIANGYNSFPIVPDPSGGAFLNVDAGDPLSRYFILWDNRVIRVMADGHTNVVGKCTFRKAFKTKFFRPVAPLAGGHIGEESAAIGKRDQELAKAMLRIKPPM